MLLTLTLLGQAADGTPWPIGWTAMGVVVFLVALAVRRVVDGSFKLNEDRRRDLEAERTRCNEEKAHLLQRITDLEHELDRLRKGEG